MSLLKDLCNDSSASGSNDSSASFRICLNPCSIIFKAHFPGMPILPGACITQIVLELYQHWAKCEAEIVKIANLKFLSVISPSAISQLDVTIEKTKTNGSLTHIKASVENDGLCYSKMSLVIINNNALNTMEQNNKFDDIRPYYSDEVPAAMQRIAASDGFPIVASYVFPDQDIKQLRAMVAGLKTTEEFQSKVMAQFNEQVIKRSITEFTVEGMDKLQKDVPYLYVSNHRDIVLDSSLLQYKLHTHGFQTTEITFGANLMSTPLIIDIGKSNKMFRVERGGTPKEFYRCSMHLSEYIRHVITEKHSSVWIAQRNGRTKDGRDKTDQGIIKMFGMSYTDDKIQSLASLNIVPVSVSYEWESCDYLKTFELYISRQQKYIKRPGEDVTSILTGITQPKGRVHFEICPAITREELAALDSLTANEYHQQVARLIDQRINSHYRLWPNNYIAHDMLYGQTTHRDRYTEQEKQAFIEHMAVLDRMALLEIYGVTDLDALHDIFLGIYANPVDQK